MLDLCDKLKQSKKYKLKNLRTNYTNLNNFYATIQNFKFLTIGGAKMFIGFSQRLPGGARIMFGTTLDKLMDVEKKTKREIDRA